MTIYAPHSTCEDLSLTEKRRFFHLFLYGSEGIKNEMLSTLYNFSDKISFQEPKDLKDYLELLIRVQRTLYDGKVTQKNSGTFNIVVGDYNKQPEQPPIMVLNAMHDPEADPESLIFSEMASKMVKEASPRKSSGGKRGSRKKVEDD